MTDEFIPLTQNFELRRADPLHAIKGVVRLPDGRPAARVDVAVCTIEKGVCIAPGRVARNSFARPIQTDSEGKFEFPSNAEAHTVVAVAREGVTRRSLKGDGQPLELRLQPWGRIEGTVQLANRVGREVLLVDHSFDRYGGGTSLDHAFSATTDSEGRFVIEQAPPGEFSLYINPRGSPHSYETPVTVKPGETTRAQIGGHGLKLRGRFELAGYEGINWSNQIGLLNFYTAYIGDPKPPSDVDRSNRIALERWKRAFWQSDEARALAKQRKSVLLEVAADGSFTAESVQPGAYDLFIQVYDRPIDRSRMEPRKHATQLGHLTGHKIRISENSPSDEPIDLGTITLSPTHRQAKRKQL